jgi:hypothetical protein
MTEPAPPPIEGEFVENDITNPQEKFKKVIAKRKVGYDFTTEERSALGKKGAANAHMAKRMGPPKKKKQDYLLQEACKIRAPHAIETIMEIMQEGSEKNRLAAAQYILDRGYGRPRQEVTGPDGKDIPMGIQIAFVGSDFRRE